MMNERMIRSLSTAEELMTRQFVRPSYCERMSSTGGAVRARERGQFRPGLRIVELDEPADATDAGHWVDHPAGATIDA